MAIHNFSPVWPGPVVLVPMTTDILLIGDIDYQSATTWASNKDNYFNLYLQQLPDQPAPFGTKHCPAVGAHLLWTLPFSIRHGKQDTTTNQVAFPAVPNRWLVTRFEYPRNINDDSIPDTKPVDVTPRLPNEGVHLLASDDLFNIDEDPDRFSQYPYVEDEWETPVKGIGKNYLLTDWTGEASTGELHLQAVGPGDVSWSVAYDNVTNVFSLHDELSDKAAIYTYSIIGWYDNPASDVLIDLPTSSKEEWLAALNNGFSWTIGDGLQDLDHAIDAWRIWQRQHGLDGDFDPSKIDLPEQAKQAIIAWHRWQMEYGDKISPAPLPVQTVCHSMVETVVWEGPGRAYGSGAPGGGTKYPDVAIGNNPVEAISSYMANKVAKETGQEAFVYDIERAFEAFQQDLIFDLEDDPVRVETLLHNNRFETAYSGQEWIVVLARQDNENPNYTGGQQTIPLSPQHTRLLKSLNQLQTEINNLYSTIATQRTELFSLSLKLSFISIDTPDNIRQRVNSSFLALKTNLQANLAEYADKSAQAANDADGLRTALGAEYVVKAVDLVAFAAPNDPVVMVAGVNQDTKLGDPTQFEDGTLLNVRMTGETVRSIQVSFTVNGGIQTKTIGAAELMSALVFPQWNAIPKEVLDLWVETLLLDVSCARLLAALFLKMCGVSNPSNTQLNPIARQIRLQQSAVWNDPVALEVPVQTLGDVAQYNGVIPAELSVSFRHGQPWTPVYMDWKVQWRPNSERPGEELRDWTLGDIDYEWTGSAITPIQNFPPFSGRAILNANAAKVIQEKFESFVADDNYNTSKIPDYIKEDLRVVAHQITKMDLLTQSMSGLTRQLTTQYITMNSYPTEEEVQELLGNSNTNFRPMAGDYAHLQPFLPIPSGHFEVLDLWVVDAFGQILRGGQQSPIPNIYWAESIATYSPNYKGNTKNFGQLPPRLAQTAKVNLDLLQGDDDRIKSNSADLTSPICGWVMPNHLDNSLIVFNAAGENMGAIIKVGREAKSPDASRDYTIRWDAVPGSNAVLGAPPDLPNEHLEAFVMRLLATAANGSGAYDDLMDSIDSSLWAMGNFGRQAGNLSVLLGRPLAVVRAEVGLSLGGLPLFNQSWIATGEFYDREGTYRLSYPPYCDVPFHLRIGDSQFTTNGVMGYFQSDNYDTFYAVYGSGLQTSRLKKALSEPASQGRLGLDEYETTLRGTPGFKTAYVNTGHLVTLPPSASPVKLTLLVDPSGDIPVIPGSLPATAVSLPNGPVASALNNLKATFRAGPLLLNPDRIQMPTPAEVKGNWAWRARKDVTTWNDEVPITPSTPVATLNTTTPSLIEGWIVLSGSNATTP